MAIKQIHFKGTLITTGSGMAKIMSKSTVLRFLHARMTLFDSICQKTSHGRVKLFLSVKKCQKYRFKMSKNIKRKIRGAPMRDVKKCHAESKNVKKIHRECQKTSTRFNIQGKLF